MADSSLAGALAIADKLGPAGVTLADQAKVAWMDGLSSGMWVAACIVGLAAIMTAIWLPHDHDTDEEIEALIEI